MRPRSFAKISKKQLHYYMDSNIHSVYTCVSVCVHAHTYIINSSTLIKAYGSQWYLNIPKMQVLHSCWIEIHFAQTI